LALERRDPLWENHFPVCQALIIHLLLNRAGIGLSALTCG
jgi:hypothetical protein